MNVKIGAKIKELRKRDDVTQEKLAEVLGVTGQAISKWESESGYPDIEYITPIANFFNVTIDYLFNHDAAEKLRKIDGYCEQARRKLPQERINIMRQAIAEFPAEEKLLFILAESLYCKWKNSPIKFIYGENRDDYTKHELSDDWKKTAAVLKKLLAASDGWKEPAAIFEKLLIASDGWKEPAAIFEKLLVSSVDDSIRSKCRWYLAMIYGGIGDKEKVIKIAETCDPVGKSRQVLLAYAAHGSKESEKYGQEAILSLFDSLSDILYKLISSRSARFVDDDLRDDIRLEATDTVVDMYMKINKLVFNFNHYDINRQTMHSYCSYAMEFRMARKIDEAYEQLINAYKHAKSWDDRFNERDEHLIKPDPDNLIETRLLPLLLEELNGHIAIHTDPLLCNDPRYTALVSKVEADIAET